MRHHDARKLLSLTNGYTVDDIRAHFVEAVKEAHPDNGGLGDIGKLTDARDLLMSAMLGDMSCPQCKGRGSIKGRIGSVDCGKCDGEGIIT